MLSKVRSFSSFTKIKLKVTLLLIIAVIFVNEFGLVVHLFERDYSTKFSYPLEEDFREILMAYKMGKTPPIKPINNHDYRFKIKNERKCKQLNEDEYDKVVILYVIKSALSNRDKRDAIRNSWGWENRFSDVVIRRIFLLGVSNDPTAQNVIDEEYATHRDLVQADFLDTYYNNTIKTLVGFKWVIQHCPKTQFITFADDDMYISTKNLLKFIRNPFNEDMDYRKLLSMDVDFNPEVHYKTRKLTTPLSAFDGRLWAGYVFFSNPMRHKMSKWYVTLDEYPFSKYPPYVTAGAYVLSYPALEDMYYVSLYTKRFRFDDVYLGIVAKKCEIEPLHNENFYFWKKPYDKASYSSVIASHGFGDPQELLNVWAEQRSFGHA